MKKKSVSPRARVVWSAVRSRYIDQGHLGRFTEVDQLTDVGRSTVLSICYRVICITLVLSISTFPHGALEKYCLSVLSLLVRQPLLAAHVLRIYWELILMMHFTFRYKIISLSKWSTASGGTSIDQARHENELSCQNLKTMKKPTFFHAFVVFEAGYS